MERPLLLHVVCSDNLGMNISQQMSLQSELQISRLRKSPNSHISQPWNTKKTLLKKKTQQNNQNQTPKQTQKGNKFSFLSLSTIVYHDCGQII